MVKAFPVDGQRRVAYCCPIRSYSGADSVGYDKPKCSEVYSALPAEGLFHRMSDYPFSRCGVWEAFDVGFRFGADAKACLKLWQKHSGQAWGVTQKDETTLQFRRVG